VVPCDEKLKDAWSANWIMSSVIHDPQKAETNDDPFSREKAPHKFIVHTTATAQT
jgi:hypothetical protein